MGALMAWQASDVSTWLSTGGLSAIVKKWSENILLVVFSGFFFLFALVVPDTEVQNGYQSVESGVEFCA